MSHKLIDFMRDFMQNKMARKMAQTVCTVNQSVIFTQKIKCHKPFEKMPKSAYQ